MKTSSVLVAPLLAVSALAQAQINATVLTQLAAGFQSLGLNQLATLAARLTNSTAGTSLLSALTNTKDPVTIFAPTDVALGSVSPSVLSNADVLSQIISYHVVHGSFGNTSAFAKSPSHTVLPTLLSNDTLVQLEAGRAQVLVATVENDKIELLNQNGTISVTNATTPALANFHVLPINGVLSPPAALPEVAKANNLSAVLAAVQQAGLTDKLTSARGITIFAPTDAALTAALAALGNTTDASLVTTVLQNHIINGTTVYSTQLGQAYTSAAGQPLKFTVDGGVVTVHSGDDSSKISAKIVKSDVLASNGVVHVIDGVLANTKRDDGAASSAYESATSAASSAATETPAGGIGGNGGSTGTGTGTGTGGNAAGRLTADWSVLAVTAVVGVVMGACSL